MIVRSILGASIVLACLFSSFANAEDNAELIELGRRIYEQGILPDNTLLKGQRPGGFILRGTQAACTTCHRRSGMGSVEGQVENIVLVAPISGPILFKPARFATSYLDNSHHYVPNKAWARALTRPAYSDATLARALHEGLDSAGRPLSAPMMRYDLDKKSLKALTVYIHKLNSQATPGMDRNGNLHLASVITPEVTENNAQAVMSVVSTWLHAARPLGKPFKLHEWRLSGKPADWGHQLKAFYQQQPVFALVSGVGAAHWQPVHEFCETQSVPCLLPSIELAPGERTSKHDYYSVYYSKGLTLEAKILARYLQDKKGAHATRLVQVYADDSGKIAAQILQDKASSIRQAVSEQRYRITSPASVLNGLSGNDSVMLWLRPEEISELVNSQKEPRVKRIYLSSLLAPPGSVDLPLPWKRRVAYVSLFDDLGVQGEIARVRLKRWLRQHRLPVGKEALRLQADAYAACYLFTNALSKIRSQEIRRPAVPLSRDQLLEMLETLVDKYSDGTEQVDPDSHVAFYGRMSLGPHQRFAVRGGQLQQYAAPGYSKLLAVSERIVP